MYLKPRIYFAWSCCCCSFRLMQEWIRDRFVSHVLGITRFAKSKWGGIFFFPNVTSRSRLQERCTLVTIVFLCPSVGECLVCFSFISVVRVVEYQPGKWLWWCQLTPHCHPRFVRQTHITKPLGHLLLFPPLLLSPILPSLSFLTPPVLYLYCDVFSASFLCSDSSFWIRTAHQWWSWHKLQ